MRLSAIGLLVTLILGVLVAPHAVAAQAPAKAARLGWLRGGPETPEVRPITDAFIQALHDLGYRVGQNATLAIRFPTGPATLSALAHELLQFQPDVIVTSSPASMEAVRQATTTVPIGAEDLETDPVASGLGERDNHPGGNLTGVFLDVPAFSGKGLELLREVVPGLTRVAVVGSRHRAGARAWAGECRAQGRGPAPRAGGAPGRGLRGGLPRGHAGAS